MLIQAFRRKSKSTHEVGGIHYEFTKNEHGHFVCDVQDDLAADTFLQINDAFKAYGEQPQRAAKAPEAVKPSKFVIAKGEEQVDLGAMTDAEVKQFADEEDLKVDKRLKGDNLREAVIASLKAE